MKECVQCKKIYPNTSFNINGRNGYRNLRCRICLAKNRKEKQKVTEPEVIKVTEPDHKICKVCGINRSIKMFSRNHLCKDGRESRCGICKKLGKKQIRNKSKYKTTPPHLQSTDQIMRLSAVTKEDYMKMWELLSVMGYDIHGEKSVHEQFIDKWNKISGHKINYRTKIRETTNMYLPDGSENPIYYSYETHKKKGV
jgi:hypothetical protein